MKNPTPQVSVIIVNWNVKDYLRHCIDSIAANCKDLSYEIIVVDNASSDDSVKMLKNDYPWVRVVANKENSGFAKANNIGFGISSGHYLVFLNPDTIVYDDALQSMISHLKENAGVGLVGSKVLNENGSIQKSHGELETIWYLIAKFLYLHWIIKASKSKGASDKFQPTGFIWGACMAMPAAVFSEVGKFSENYFMYGEDNDLSRKVLGKGYKIHWLPQARILHYGGKSSTQREDEPDMRRNADYQYYISLKVDKGKIYAKIWALLQSYFALRKYIKYFLNTKKPYRAISYSRKLNVLLKAVCERGGKVKLVEDSEDLQG